MNEQEFLEALSEEVLRSDHGRHALTHRSAAGAHNERLEFLGDALLNLIIAEALYHSRPEADDGELTRMRPQLVKSETLAGLAAEINLGAHLTVGPGEPAGDICKPSLLADALEAVFAATYLVRGLEAVRKLVLAMYGERLRTLPEAEFLKDSKSRLQEMLQARGLPVPIYHLVAEKGASHRRSFCVRCRIDALGIEAEGTGSSKKRAEQEAAERALLGLDAL